MNFYQRYVELCAKCDKSPSAVALENGFSKATITGWKSGRTNPTDASLAKLAAYFNVSIEYLKGESDAKEKAATVYGDDLSERDIQFLKKVDLLTNPVMQRLLVAGSLLDAEDLERLADLAESLAKAKAHQ